MGTGTLEILVIVLGALVAALFCVCLLDARRIGVLKKEIWKLKDKDLQPQAVAIEEPKEGDVQTVSASSVFRRCDMPLDERNRIKAMFFDLDDQVEGKELYLECDLTREKLADFTTFTKDQASDIIKRATGGNFASYINGKRIAHAILELREHQEYTVEAVAFDSGFGNARNFYRVFRDKFGISPTEYRSAIR